MEKSVLRCILTGLVLVAISAMGSNGLAQTNMLANPGFEEGGGSYQGWFTFGSGVQISTAETDNIMRTGLAASKIYGEFTGCPGSHPLNVGGYGQAFTPVAGRIYEFSGYSYISSGDAIPGGDPCTHNRCIAKVVFWDAESGGYEISSNEIIIGDGNMPLDEWIPFSVSAPAPASARRVEALILFLQPGCDSGAVFIDDLCFYEIQPESEPNLLTNPSFSGGLQGWTKFGNVYYDARYWAVRTPAGSVKMFSTFQPGYDSGMFQTVPAQAESTYKLEVYTLNTCWESPLGPDNDNFVLAQLVFRSPTQILATKDTVVADNTSPLGTWTKHTLVATAPAGTESLDVYFLFISPSQMGGAIWLDDVLLRTAPQAGVGDQMQGRVSLSQNSPNPFSGLTRIDFEIPESKRVQLSIYDVEGKLVRTLLDDLVTERYKEVFWDGKDTNGKQVSEGIYFYRLSTDNSVATRKMVLIR